MIGQNSASVLSVSELNEYARKLIAVDPLLRSFEVMGEISGYKHHSSGHRYFSLKDEQSRVQCVMFRQNAFGLKFEPADGMRVILRASASIFTRDGAFQLYVSSIEKAGQGDLFAQFERLKQSLMKEGLFDPARKREIPRVPRCIGVVTSDTGAAIRDIIHVTRRRNPNMGILIAPCAVQGEGASDEIVRSIERLNANGEPDVLLVGRGGGSIEDLWAFNEEKVARAIAASRIPVISCVGHETDFTIADFVADLRAPTPSAAAEIAVPVLKDLQSEISGAVYRVGAALKHAQNLRRLSLKQLAASRALTDPQALVIKPRREAVAQFDARLSRSLPIRLEKCRQALGAFEASLRALNPDSVLERGYAIVRQEGRIVQCAAATDPGAPIRIGFADGSVDANITSVEIEK